MTTWHPVGLAFALRLSHGSILKCCPVQGDSFPSNGMSVTNNQYEQQAHENFTFLKSPSLQKIEGSFCDSARKRYMERSDLATPLVTFSAC